ncbi:hypothetical protein LEP1GSC071_1466 [Leptospira santarosai str. JET]|uniref:Uncharacterized protein n=1 Tax=Leptospira santarosai serovar Shermani str. LT 821 TaxID=758847 RepID=K8XYL4_9LEPT|nr:hypothetical protein LEP1GSC071_1466 [Leptospira santarosai str. JET]EKT86523.1 hypothetical protein LSS_11585 [Leptospira santarosai serovar Shermani str. LT 821]EPG83211.1 hypothetical protein LEP1GSC048_1552 [Leptospira santarosai serovar Shermani str. 1342KT]
MRIDPNPFTNLQWSCNLPPERNDIKFIWNGSMKFFIEVLSFWRTSVSPVFVSKKYVRNHSMKFNTTLSKKLVISFVPESIKVLS